MFEEKDLTILNYDKDIITMDMVDVELEQDASPTVPGEAPSGGVAAPAGVGAPPAGAEAAPTGDPLAGLTGGDETGGDIGAGGEAAPGVPGEAPAGGGDLGLGEVVAGVQALDKLSLMLFPKVHDRFRKIDNFMSKLNKHFFKQEIKEFNDVYDMFKFFVENVTHYSEKSEELLRNFNVAMLQVLKKIYTKHKSHKDNK